MKSMSNTFQLGQVPELREIRNSSNGCDDLISALVSAQASIGAAIADKENTYHRSKYADLAAVFEAIRPAFAENGIGVMQFPFTRTGTITRSYREEVWDNGKSYSRPVYQAMVHNEDDPDSRYEELVPVNEIVPVIYVIVTTRLIHRSGQWIEQDLEIPVAMGKNPAQATGIAITYGKRYALQAIAGVPSDDDDGNALNGTGVDAGIEDEGQQLPAARPRATTRTRPASSRPKGKLASHCDRLRLAENLITLRGLYESSVRSFEQSGTQNDLAELERVKDEVKEKLLEAEARETPPLDPEKPEPDAQSTPNHPPQAKRDGNGIHF